MDRSTAMTALHDAFLAQMPDDVQRAAFTQFAAKGLPHPRAENWRWSNLHGAIGQTLDQENLEQNDDSVTLAGASTATIATENTDPLALLAIGLSNRASRKGFVIDQTPDAPITLETRSTNKMTGSQVQIRIAAGCRAVLIENTQRASQSLSVDLREFVLEPGASLTRIICCENAPKQTRIQQAFVEVGEGGSYRQFTLDFGALVSRNETHIIAGGANTDVLLNGAYLLDGSAQTDSTSIVHHHHLEGRTRQLVKGVVLGKAQAVFQGKFHVARAGQKTDAKMGHHSLLLSDAAKVKAKPELEIYADDVACAHGNTTGRLDEVALFYMRQRGLSLDAAKTLLIRAFVNEVFQPLDDEILQEPLVGQINQWMEQHL